MPKLVLRHWLQAVGGCLAKMIVQLVARNPVAPSPELVCRTAGKAAEAGCDGVQRLLKYVLRCRGPDGAEHEKPQLRLDDPKHLLGQPQTLCQSGRQSIRA